jgi:hypothetical protein
VTARPVRWAALVLGAPVLLGVLVLASAAGLAGGLWAVAVDLVPDAFARARTALRDSFRGRGRPPLGGGG